MKEILSENMKVPDSCEVNKPIYKKLFYENAYLGKKDQELLSKNIEKITWLYSFKPDTINILPYNDKEREYEEIAVIEVLLREQSHIKRIAEIIQLTIPYPLIIIFNYGQKILFNVAHKRVNMSDESRNTYEELIFTDWVDLASLNKNDKKFIKSLDITKFSFTNFYWFYSDFVDRINIFNVSLYADEYLLEHDANDLKQIHDEIKDLEQRISQLQSDLKKEDHFNKKVKMNVEIKKLKEEKKNLIDKLNS
ncbi:DUF4391 domain-containing protein [Natranaerobius thermophilus]|uniref:DUF4391 domain-containing protein n=1 Tax=Natranaerobius thermophilus (strain ATCC BAA-1301 / DSM 18059 / JW/NM-WN-LF) TaxID=457570 RepID=B2A5C6_NATTJ|nr:DUF4391 domain-containing protein [Natranaerobius thermophilus]ACB83960.1 conserved hypothetical protein [Natranaerobius thermophilus JW/NM-WN-LF]